MAKDRIDIGMVEGLAADQVQKRLELAGEEIRLRAVAILSLPGTPSEGSAPHTRTGELADSIEARVDMENLTVEVGSPLEKARVLDAGTRSRPAHPFLRRALIESMPILRRIFGAK